MRNTCFSPVGPRSSPPCPPLASTSRLGFLKDTANSQLGGVWANRTRRIDRALICPWAWPGSLAKAMELWPIIFNLAVRNRPSGSTWDFSCFGWFRFFGFPYSPKAFHLVAGDEFGQPGFHFATLWLRAPFSRFPRALNAFVDRGVGC